jgi:transposase-like protein
MSKDSTLILSTDLLLEVYPSEAETVACFEKLRWGGAVCCSYCAHPSPYTISNTHKYKCVACRQIFTVRIKTIFESSRLPLQKWILLLYLILTQGETISALFISKTLGITRKSALRIQHKLNHASKLVRGKNEKGKWILPSPPNPVISQAELESCLKDLILLKPDRKTERKKIGRKALKLTSWGKS